MCRLSYFDAMDVCDLLPIYGGHWRRRKERGGEENRHLVPAGSKVFLSIEQVEAEQEKVAQELYKAELLEQKKIEEEKQALLNELNQGVHKERNDQIKVFSLGGLALLLLL